MSDKIIKGKYTDMLFLAPDEEVPESLIKNDGSKMWVEQGGAIWTIDNNPIFSHLSEFDPKNRSKFFEDSFGKNQYKPNNIYSLADRREQYPLPVELVRYVMRYFQEIYRQYKCEAGVVLMVNFETKEWRVLFVPQIDCGPGRVNYLMPRGDDNVNDWQKQRLYKACFEDDHMSVKMLESYETFNRWTDENFCVFGTIHSHCEMSAFHSGVDDNDEYGFDGLHITIGKVESGWDFSCRWIFKRASWPQTITEVCDVKDIKEITEGVEAVAIAAGDMDFIRPELGTGHFVKSYNNGGHSHQHNGHHFSRDFELAGDGFDYSSRSYNWGGYALYEDNVIEESKGIRLYNIDTQRCIWVKTTYYHHNKEKFPTNIYVKLEDPPIPKNARKLSRTHQPTIKNENYLKVANNNNMNPNYPKGPKVGTGIKVPLTGLSDTDRSLAIYGKARKGVDK